MVDVIVPVWIPVVRVEHIIVQGVCRRHFYIVSIIPIVCIRHNVIRWLIIERIVAVSHLANICSATFKIVTFPITVLLVVVVVLLLTIPLIVPPVSLLVPSIIKSITSVTSRCLVVRVRRSNVLVQMLLCPRGLRGDAVVSVRVRVRIRCTPNKIIKFSKRAGIVVSSTSGRHVCPFESPLRNVVLNEFTTVLR